MFSNSKVTLAFAAVVVGVALFVSLAVGRFVAQDDGSATEEVASPASERAEGPPVVTWAEDEELSDGWGSSAIAAAQSDGGFSASPASSRPDPFGTYTPEPDQETTGRSIPLANGQPRRIIRGNEAAMLERREGGTAVLPFEPRVVR